MRTLENLKALKHLYIATLLDMHFAGRDEVEVIFTKASDGSTRVMKCTTDANTIYASTGDSKDLKELSPSDTKPANLVAKRVFDLEKNAFRAFNYDTVQTVDGMTLAELDAKYTK